MNQNNDQAQIRASLFYKNACPPCQWMSKLAVIMALGTIKRIPLSSVEAEAIYRNYPEQEGQLMLKNGHRMIFGRAVFAEVPICILFAWWRCLLSFFRTPQ